MQWPGQVFSKNINAKIIVCELSVKSVVTFGLALYCYHWPINFILQLAELHIGSSIRCKHTLVGNHFLKCDKFKIILISFNCFSEYILNENFHANDESICTLVKCQLFLWKYKLVKSHFFNFCIIFNNLVGIKKYTYFTYLLPVNVHSIYY